MFYDAMQTNWIPSIEFAKLVGLTRRSASRICHEFATGKRHEWNGLSLAVKHGHTKGGNSGCQYLVKVDSLPARIQSQLNAVSKPVEQLSRLRTGSAAQLRRNWIYDLIRPILDAPKHSAEREALVMSLHGTKRLDWKGQYRQLARTTIYTWVRIFEQKGYAHIVNSVRADKGIERTYCSREWMNAVPFDDDVKKLIHQDLKQYVRGLIKGGAQEKITLHLAGDKLAELTARHGYRPIDPLAADRIFRLPRRFVQNEAHYKVVYQRNFDRKAYEDNAPRIRRTIAGLQPMEIVVMDVHHINVLMQREDGSTATPKLLAFHDVATNRVFWEIIFFERRGGVRNSDVITAFVKMCQHPAFGIPQHLYCDNGAEYSFADDLEDALKLGAALTPFIGREDRNRVIRAIPYNAAAKVVEGLFRQLNQQYFRHLPGWIDDDRMNPKTPKVGKIPTPYSSGFDGFTNLVSKIISAYDEMPQKGSLKDQSPSQAFTGFIESGWTATLINPDQLLTVFTKPESRVVKKHGIEVDGRVWNCEGLFQFLGSKVTALIPKYHGFNCLLVEDLQGNRIGEATPDTAYKYLDQRGAVESARRKSVRNKAVIALDKSVPNVNVGEELAAFGKRRLPVAPNEPNGTIFVDRDASPSRAIVPDTDVDAWHAQQEAQAREVSEARAEMMKAWQLRKAS